jgi:hypothetical protein
MRHLILFLCVIFALSGCSRDKEDQITGVVIEKGACFADSYLVELPGESAATRSFLCETTVPLSTMMNCRNAVFIRLPANLAIPGKRIRFIYTATEPSCLSYSFAPQHITVKSLRSN